MTAARLYAGKHYKNVEYTYDADGNRIFQLNYNLHTDDDWKGNSGNGNGNNKDNSGSGNSGNSSGNGTGSKSLLDSVISFFVGDEEAETAAAGDTLAKSNGNKDKDKGNDGNDKNNGKGNGNGNGNSGNNGNGNSGNNGNGNGNSSTGGNNDNNGDANGNTNNTGGSQNQSGILFPIEGEVSELEAELIGMIKTTGKEKNYELVEYVNDVNREHVEVLMELNINGIMDTAYSYGNQRLTNERFTEWTGYYTYDPRGSVTGVTDSEGMIWQSYRYNANGDMTFGKPQYNNVYGYNAESYNPNMESQYLRARYYNVLNANFITEDSHLGRITDPLTLNRYNYVKSNPLNYTDPSGFVSQKISEDELRTELLINYESDIGMKWRRVYSGSEAIDIIIEYDEVISETASKYGIKKSYIQAVLFREIYCIGYEDDWVADNRVVQTYSYYKQLEIYNNAPWWRQIILGGPPAAPLPGIYSLDSSTGLGQLFASTAIKAHNWAIEQGIIDKNHINVDDVYQRMDMWEKLKYDDNFNINMVGLVLMYEAVQLGYVNTCTLTPEQGMQVIGKYNGNIAYGQLVYKYVEIFDRYNN